MREAPETPAFPLTLAPEGERVRVFLLRGGRGLEMRLASLGPDVGSQLTISQRQGHCGDGR
jgi:ferrous iron transport protein A